MTSPSEFHFCSLCVLSLAFFLRLFSRRVGTILGHEEPRRTVCARKLKVTRALPCQTPGLVAFVQQAQRVIPCYPFCKETANIRDAILAEQQHLHILFFSCGNGT